MGYFCVLYIKGNLAIPQGFVNKIILFYIKQLSIRKPFGLNRYKRQFIKCYLCSHDNAHP